MKKNYAILIGRKGSTGFPKKNLLKLYNKYIFEYPLLACKKSDFIEKVFVSTDCPKIKEISKKKYGCELINRPKNLSTNKALGDHVFIHAYNEIVKREDINKKQINLLVLLFANGATVTSKMIRCGIEFLNKNKNRSFDSAVSVSKYNMWSPLRARKINKDGSLKPFVPFKTFGDPKTLNCDRDSQGDVYFADMGVSVIRPNCLDNYEKNLLPQKWMGKKIAPIFSEAGFDIDYKWQLPLLKYWIKKYYG